MDQEELFDEIIEVCSKRFGPTRARILGGTRDANFVEARHAAMFLAVECGKFSCNEAAGHFACDRSAVSHAVTKLKFYSSRLTPEGRELNHTLTTLLNQVQRIVKGGESEDRSHGGGYTETKVIPVYWLDLTDQEEGWLSGSEVDGDVEGVVWYVETGYIVNVGAVVEFAAKGEMACGGSPRMKNLIEEEAKQCQYIWIFRKVKNVTKKR